MCFIQVKLVIPNCAYRCICSLPHLSILPCVYLFIHSSFSSRWLSDPEWNVFSRCRLCRDSPLVRFPANIGKSWATYFWPFWPSNIQMTRVCTSERWHQVRKTIKVYLKDDAPYQEHEKAPEMPQKDRALQPEVMGNSHLWRLQPPGVRRSQKRKIMEKIHIYFTSNVINMSFALLGAWGPCPEKIVCQLVIVFPLEVPKGLPHLHLWVIILWLAIARATGTGIGPKPN